MKPTILVAGIGNIFYRDDAFGVSVAAKLIQTTLPPNVCAIDFGIRGFDLALELLRGYEFTILVDAISRGAAPGTQYTIEPDLETLEKSETQVFESAHGLDPLKVLKLARNLGASLGRVVVVGCEPAVLDDEGGQIGLSPVVQWAVDPAVETIRSLISVFNAGRKEAVSEVERQS